MIPMNSIRWRVLNKLRKHSLLVDFISTQSEDAANGRSGSIPVGILNAFGVVWSGRNSLGPRSFWNRKCCAATSHQH